MQIKCKQSVFTSTNTTTTQLNTHIFTYIHLNGDLCVFQNVGYFFNWFVSCLYYFITFLMIILSSLLFESRDLSFEPKIFVSFWFWLNINLNPIHILRNKKTHAFFSQSVNRPLKSKQTDNTNSTQTTTMQSVAILIR